jgi:hypothetical protein
MTISVATPLWGSCEVAIHTPKNGTWESSETPENSEHDCRGQNTLHRGVVYTFGKVLKCRCPKWPCMSHLDICSTSYGRKKGRESTRLRCVQMKCDTSLERSQGELQLWIRPRPDPSLGWEVMNAQSLESSDQDSFGTTLWESWGKKSFGCKCNGELQRILYGGRWWLPQVQAVVSQVNPR